MKKKGKKRWERTPFLKFIIIVLGLALCIGSLIPLSYLLRPVTESRRNICGFYAEKRNSLDMVYVGGSACYAYWEPLRAWNGWGFTSYNFATDALQPQVIKYILKEIQKTQSPQLFLIDIRPFQYGDEYYELEDICNMERVAPFRNVSDNMKFSRNRYELIQSSAPSQEEEWTYQFDLAKYHSNLIAFVMPENWQYLLNEKKLDSKGFCPMLEKTFLPFASMQEIEEETFLEKEVDETLLDLLDYCEKEDLRVLFIVHAYCNHETDQMKYNYMEKVIKEYGQDFLNVNDFFYEIGFDVANDFNDMNHVNVLGADKYSDFLGQYLNEHYDLPDHREDSEYEQWNHDYEQWNAGMEEIREQVRNVRRAEQ